MRKLFFFGFILLQQNVLAHHTKDHMIFWENPDEVMGGTQQGSIMGDWIWLIWIVVAIMLCIGLYKSFKK